jgi:hypothetical protein
MYAEFQNAYELEKTEYLKVTPQASLDELEVIRKRIVDKFKQTLGKRIKDISCGKTLYFICLYLGGAPSSKATMDFLKECFGSAVGKCLFTND